MRIIAGKYRRRKLLANPGDVTRPITDRVKETLFERLGKRVAGRRVADLFAGTGTLGLEALSRGAQSVVFVENDRRAFELLEQNIARLGVKEATLCLRADVFRCSFRPKGAPQFFPYDLVFFDPPYRMAAGIRPGRPLYRALLRLAREDVTAAGALLVVRAPVQAEFECPPQWIADRPTHFGGMTIHVFDKRLDESAPDTSSVRGTPRGHAQEKRTKDAE